MELTNYKKLLVRCYKNNLYTLAQMRSISTPTGTNRAFTYEEFAWVVGITIEEYDANVDFYKDMRYEDINLYLAEKEQKVEE